MYASLVRYALLSLAGTILGLGVQIVRAQDGEAKRQRELCDTILSIADRRIPGDTTLQNLLNDPHPDVREQAALAYGSLQDTTVLPLLVRNLAVGDAGFQQIPAFAIGQTGSLLSPTGRRQLEQDLIRTWLDRTGAQERLLEEMGKFGTEQGLRDLIAWFKRNVGGTYGPGTYSRGLTLGIARFAIRGIATDESTNYLLSFITPADTTPWEVAYALQRIGPSPAVKRSVARITSLSRHPDPLVRMNIATLLGKIHDAGTSLQPVAAMADTDSDWRVRVNAIRALAAFPIHTRPEMVAIFHRAFLSEYDNVSITALTAFGQTGLSPTDTSRQIRETFHLLRTMTENKDGKFPWQRQGAAALTFARLCGPAALPSLQYTAGGDAHLNAQMLEAIGATGASESAPILVAASTSAEPIVQCAALNGLLALAGTHPSDLHLLDQSYSVACASVQSEDIAIVSTAAGMLGDSLLLRRESVPLLIERLKRAVNPDDIEVVQGIAETLGKLGDQRAVGPLTDVLKNPNRAAAAAAADALSKITGRSYDDSLLAWYPPAHVDLDFAYLRQLQPIVRVVLQTTRGDITINLVKSAAPFTIMNLLKLASGRNFYRGLAFHRVVPNFVVQGGDPRGDGWGGPGYTIRSEFSWLSYATGTVGIASAGKDTEGCQFFITHSPQPHLDGRYTIIGKVVGGMDVVDRIQVGDRIVDLARAGR